MNPGVCTEWSLEQKENINNQKNNQNLALEEELLDLKGEISLIAGIPPKERNPEQTNKLRCLKRKEKNIETQLGANVAVKPKIAAARKAAQRERQDLAASTSSFKRKSSEPITGIPNKMAAVQEQEEEDSYPDLPSPGYVPLRRAAADKDQNPGGQVSENLALEEELLNLKGEISLIAGITAKERNPEQKKKLRCLKKKEKKIETQLGTNVAVKPKTAADWKAAQRERQDLAAKEKENAANRAAIAAHRLNQDLAAKEVEKAAAQAGMAAHRPNQDLAAAFST